jgi:DNA-binding MarR family transcriptional regulator
LKRRNTPTAPNESPAFDFDSGISSPALDTAPLPLDAPGLAGQVDLRVLSAIRRIIRSVDLYSRELAATARVTSPQLVCLLAIADKEKTTATIISRQVFLSPSTIVGILDRLEAKGLVRRERDENDRRVITITITEKGKRLARSAPSPLQDTLTEALRELPGNEQTKIAESLERIVALMEARRINAASLAEADPVVRPNSIVQD